MGDLTVQCYTAEWTQNSIVAAFFILIFPVGFPLMTFVILSRNRHRLHIEQKFKKRFGFAHERYEENFWFWEITEMLRKVLLCGVMMFVEPASMAQLSISILIGALFLCIHIKCQPFDTDRDDNFQSAALMATFLTLALSVIIRAGEHIDTTTFCVMVVNAWVLSTAFYAMVVDLIPAVIEEYKARYHLALSLTDMLTVNNAAATAAATAVPVPVTSVALYTFSDSASQTTVKAKTARPPHITKTVKMTAAQPSEVHAENRERVETAVAGEQTVNKLNAQIHKIFARHDFDGSGTVSSFEELRQMCCNLAYTLPELRIDTAKLESVLADAEAANATIEWDLQTFTSWFECAFDAK